MVTGLDLFESHFAKYADQYVLIGGSAAALLMESLGAEFRATKDLDIVLLVESLHAEFANAFWDFIRKGGYQHRQQSSGKRNGERVDSRDIRKHKNDIYRLYPILNLPQGCPVAPTIQRDLQNAFQTLAQDPVDLKPMGLAELSPAEILQNLSAFYRIHFFHA